MSHAISHRSRPFRLSYVALLLFTLTLASMILQRTSASPLPDTTSNYSTTDISSTTLMNDSASNTEGYDSDSSTEGNSTEMSNTDMYVIKAVVYEIGILADTNSSTSESTDRQESVNISVYNTPQDDEFY